MEPSPVCRVCFEDEADTDKLIAPCRCKGSSKYIHQACLRTWLMTQMRERIEAKCEVCKYLFNVEVKEIKKCDPRTSMKTNPYFICYFCTLLMIIAILVVILMMIIQKKYVDPKKNVGYFIGVLTIFLFGVLCSLVIVFKLIKGLCFVKYYDEYKIFPFKEDDLDLNTTNILNSIYRVESSPYEIGVRRAEDLERDGLR